MRERKLLRLLLFGAAAAAVLMTCDARAHRSARPDSLSAPDPNALERPFDPAESAAVFVGVRTFTDPTLASVPYAVDDAIDLAYALAAEGKSPLVRPGRVVLLLAGDPCKDASAERLKELKEAGATVRNATQSEILDALQSARPGPHGMFIVSFATHGYSSAGAHSMLAADSRWEDPQSAIATDTVLDVAAAATRSLVFLDTCRQRMTATRFAGTQPDTTAPRGINRRTSGQVVFFAASAGQYAYDCDGLRNGCFTAAVIDSLHGKAEMDAQGAITVDALQEYVARRLRRHRPPAGIQVNYDSGAREMVVAVCRLPPGHPNPAAATSSGPVLHALDENDSELWHKQMEGEIAAAAVADLNGDRRNEVVVSLIRAGGGRLSVLDSAGDPLWSYDTAAPLRFVIDDLHKKREIVVYWGNADGSSQLTILSLRGKPLACHSHPGPILSAIFGQKTSRHGSRLIAAASDEHCAGIVFALHARKGDQLWYGCTPHTIRELVMIDYDNDGRREIEVRTVGGKVFHLDLDGNAMEEDAPFRRVPSLLSARRSTPASAATPRTAHLPGGIGRRRGRNRRGAARRTRCMIRVVTSVLPRSVVV